MPDYPIDKNVKKNPSKDLKLADNLDQTPKYVQSKEGSDHVNTPLAISTEKILIKGDLDVVGQITTNGTAVSTGSDDNTTYTISTADGLAGSKKIIRLTGSDSSVDNVTLVAGTGITLSQSSDEITITNSVTDTDTVLSTEQVQDIVGAMFSGNTETNIAVTYEDADGTLDLVATGDVTLAGDQTFTGRKTFNKAFPQVKFTDDGGTDYVSTGLSGNTFFHKGSDDDIDFGFRNASNDDILIINSGTKSVLINDTTAGNFNFKIGDNGRMNMPVRGFEFENAHGYFSPTGDMFLPIFISGTQTDLIRFQTPLTWEYYDYSASAWVDDSSNISNFKNMLDGRRATQYSVTNTKRKFRFVIERASTWADDQLFYIENTWSDIGTFSSSASGGGSLTPTATIERLDGSFDASDDSNNDWTTNSGITTDWHTTGIVTGFGLMMYYSTAMHNSETHIRITVTIPEYADTSQVFNIKNIGAMSSYSSQNTNQQPFLQDFDRNATGYGHLNIPSGHDYKINASSVLNATTLGSGVVNSSLTSVGTISSGTWNGTAIASAYLDSDTAHLSGTQTFSGEKTFSANTIFGGDITLNADNKIKSNIEPTRNFIEFDDDSGSPENQTLVSSITNVALIVDANGNNTGQFEVLKAGTDSTATELFRIENDGDAVFTGDITVSGLVKISAGGPQLIFADTTDDDDHKIQFWDESNNVVHIIRTSDNTGGGLGDSLCIGSVENKPLQFITQDTTRMVIDGTGKVGIGTQSPTTTLDVEGSISYKHVALTADSDDLDVSGVAVVECTPSGTDRLGGLTGGVQGQILYIVKVDSGLGRCIIEHAEGTGNQDIRLFGGVDLMLNTRKGITLYCTGSEWIQVG